MRSGLACDDWDASSPGNENGLQGRVDWVTAVMELPMVADPGTVPRSCSGGVVVAARMLECAAGETLPAFGGSRLMQ